MKKNGLSQREKETIDFVQGSILKALEQNKIDLLKEFKDHINPSSDYARMNQITEEFNISKETVNKWVQKEIVQSYKMEGVLLFKRSEFINLIRPNSYK